MQNDNSILEELNTYNLKVNEDLIRYLVYLDAGNERIAVLMSHIVNSHQVWLERINRKSMTVKPFDIRPFDSLIDQNISNYQITSYFINERDLSEKIKYVNIKRQKFENTITEMFIHLFNHATYHRGQINQLLVQEGKKALVTDFIVYNRTEIL